jgi:Zn finger protein HypA/HybF involved in hydrogenase expression
MGENTAVYCERCEIVFEAEERELFLDQIYCPSCTHRTDETQRAKGIDELLRSHVHAHAYAG